MRDRYTEFVLTVIAICLSVRVQYFDVAKLIASQCSTLPLPRPLPALLSLSRGAGGTRAAFRATHASGPLGIVAGTNHRPLRPIH